MSHFCYLFWFCPFCIKVGLSFLGTWVNVDLIVKVDSTKIYVEKYLNKSIWVKVDLTKCTLVKVQHVILWSKWNTLILIANAQCSSPFLTYFLILPREGFFRRVLSKNPWEKSPHRGYHQGLHNCLQVCSVWVFVFSSVDLGAVLLWKLQKSQPT